MRRLSIASHPLRASLSHVSEPALEGEEPPMRPLVRSFVGITGLVCAAGIAAGVVWLSNTSGSRKNLSAAASPPAAPGRNNEPARPADVVIDPRQFEDSGFKTASQFTGTIRDPASLKDLQEALRARARWDRRAHRPLRGIEGRFFQDRAKRRTDGAREIARAHYDVRRANRASPLAGSRRPCRASRGRTLLSKSGPRSRPSWASSL